MLKTEFKITKCLVSDDAKHMQLMKCVVVNDKKARIQRMGDGTEYFVLPNPYNKRGPFKHTYMQRVGDIIKVITEDKADCILSKEGINVLSNDAEAIVFLNRKKGEFFHKKAKEQFAKVRVGYQIEYCNRSTFGFTPLDKKGNACIFGIGTPCVYATEQEAKEALDKYLAKAKRMTKKVANSENPDITPIYKESVPKFVQDLATDMLVERYTNTYAVREDINNLPNVCFTIVQTLV